MSFLPKSYLSKKEKIIILIVLSFNTSCSYIQNLSSTPDQRRPEEVDMIYKNDVDPNLEILVANMGFGITKTSITDNRSEVSGSSIGINLAGAYHNFKFGEVRFDFYAPMKFRKGPTPNTLINANQSLPKSSYNLSLYYSLFKWIQKEEVKIPGVNSEKKRYYLYGFPIDLYHKINLRSGFGERYLLFYTGDFVTEGDFLAEVSQKNSILRLGLGYQLCINTRVEAIDKNNEKLNGKLSSMRAVNFDLLFLNQSRGNATTYQRIEKDDFGEEIVYSEDLTPDRILRKRNFGFSMSFEFSNIPYKEDRVLTSTEFEFGVMPGHFENLNTAMYLQYTIKLGLGLTKRMFNRKTI